MKKLFLDANILFSATCSDSGASRMLFKLAKGDKVSLLSSTYAIEEALKNIEKKLGGISHTIRTIEHLKKENPDCRFYLVTGTDVRREAPDWYQFDRIREIVSIIEVPRGETSPIPNVSSTEIRKKIDKGESFHKHVESEVAIYIITKSLYRKKN